MRLEEEIKQKKFRNESQKLAVNIIYTYNWLQSQHTAFFKSYGLTPQQFNVLRILRGMNGSPASIKLIRDRMLDKMSDTSRIIEKLRLKELVERTTSSSDRRSCEVLVTSKGLKVLEKIDAASETLDGLFSAMHETEMKSLNNLLDNLRG